MTETLTLLDAERLSGISRRTLGRLLADGRLSGERTPTGWQIDAESLAAVQAAGLAGRRSTSMPSTPTTSTDEVESLRAQVAAAQADAAGLRTEVESLRAQVAALTDEMAEQVRRADVAEAVAAERGSRLDGVDARLAQALDALTAGQMLAGAQIAERGPVYAASVALVPKRPRVWDRWRNRHDGTPDV